MKKLILNLFILIPFVGLCQNPLKLWYQHSANAWTEALPVGNGRLGAMVFGKENEELIQLNESTLWSGGPVTNNVNPDAPKYLPKIRQAIFEGDYKKASELSKKMQGVYSESYLPLGDLIIKQEFKSGTPETYYRDLNIEDAIATTRFKKDGISYTRQVFASAADQVIVIRITADKPNKLTLKIATGSPLRHENFVVDNHTLATKGKAPSHVDPSYVSYNRNPIIYNDSASNCKGMRFTLLTKALNKGGSINSDTSGITIKNATEVVLLLSAATSFNGFDKCPVSQGKDENQISKKYLEAAAAKSFNQLLTNHLADYHRYFNRVTLSLKNNNNNNGSALPTNKRLAAYTNGSHDVGLEELYFQYGRYLLISCSRPGGTPANLQGIWNNDIRPPWSSNFTTNINLQMNYWPAEVTNLSELHQPLFSLIRNLSVNGKKLQGNFISQMVGLYITTAISGLCLTPLVI